MNAVNAPAKLNLCLFLGPRRDDGLHELCSLFHPLQLADRLVVSDSPDGDEVVCPAVKGPNLAAAALAELREAGWKHPPIRIEIEKRIPIAAGLGGGSADAAAVLRLAETEVGELPKLASRLGADVPSQLEPRPALVRGAGERVEPVAVPNGWAAVLLAEREGLSTAEVFAEADRLGLGREPAELDRIAAELRAALRGGASPLGLDELLENDLLAAAVSLRPEIEESLAALREAGAELARMTGSGPTVFGLFADIAKADAAARSLPARYGGAIVTGAAGEG